MFRQPTPIIYTPRVNVYVHEDLIGNGACKETGLMSTCEQS